MAQLKNQSDLLNQKHNQNSYGDICQLYFQFMQIMIAKVWVPTGVCPSGCEEYWEPEGLRILGAPTQASAATGAVCHAEAGEHLGAPVGATGFTATIHA